MHRTILKTIAGSKLHGTDIAGVSDTDYLGVFIESPEDKIGFSPKDVIESRTKPKDVKAEAGDVETTLYGLGKFLSLALKGNPTILTVLFAPDEMMDWRTIEGLELQALAPRIISKQVLGPFQGYMRQQYERLIGERGQKNVVRPELVAKYGYDTKYASHIIRLGQQGIELLEGGKLTLPMMPGSRSLILDVRNGAYSFDGVLRLIEKLELDLKEAYNKSSLQEKPDYKSVEEFMLKCYLAYWKTDPKKGVI